MHLSNPSAVDVFRERFVNRTDAYYQQWASGNGFGYQAIYQPVTLTIIEDHLDGRITVSLPAVSTTGLCRWCAWDSDTEDGNLPKIEAVLHQLNWYPMKDGRRAGREGHLWLFFDEPIQAADLLSFDQQVRTRARVPNHLVEFFPKQAKPSALGSALRAPLGIHRKPGADRARAWFEGAERDVKTQLEWFRQQPLNPAQRVREIALLSRQTSTRKPLHQRRVYTAGQPISFESAIEKTGAKPGSNGWYHGHCPTRAHQHGDRHPSLGLRAGDRGQAIVSCFLGCQARDIYQALG